MIKTFLGKLKESVFSILPISLIVVILSLIFVPNAGWSIFCFCICSIMLMIGICLFNIGSDISLMKMGGYVGSHLTKSKKIFLMLLCSLLIGAMVTIAEPDLFVLASQIPWLNKWIFVAVIGISVGVCLMVAVLRIVLKIKLQYIIAVCYGIILILMFFVPSQFLPISFDASGVTTGPISVPFIMSFGLGMAAVRSGESNKDDGFGLVALCSIGPIFAVMILSVIYGANAGATSGIETYQTMTNFGEISSSIGYELLNNLKDVLLILTPIVIFFLIYQFSALKLPKRNLLQMGIGVLYTYFGIVLFFTGVNAGYLPLANILSTCIVSSDISWVVIPICLLFGLFIAIAEPAVHVLNKQVEDVSSGAISRKMMLISLSIGISLSVVLSVIRIMFQINVIFFYFPVLLLAIVLMFFVPKQVSSIAFDSGGVASGALSSSFILPFMQGVCLVCGSDQMVYGFGTIGLIVLVPILVIEIMGIKLAVNEKRFNKIQSQLDKIDKDKISIIEFD